MSLYRKILAQAWKITWRYKYLWFFGLFAALLGNGGEYEMLARGFNGETDGAVLPAWQQLADTGVFQARTINNIGSIMKDDPFALIMLTAIGLVILLLLCFLVWLAVVSQAALVNNASVYAGDKKSDFKSGLASGIKNFWPVLGLNAASKLIIYLAFLSVGLPIAAAAARSANVSVNLLYIAAFIILVAVALAVSFIIKYAIAYTVIKGSNFMGAVRSGWQLFVKNWLISIEMAFILFFINFLVGLALVLIILILAVPFLFAALMLYKLFYLTGFWAVAVLALILFLAIIILGGAILATFQISSWTGLFMELVNKGGVAKIVRLVEEWKDK
ncbi:hypothetical protein HY798_04155 [Candidatus Falkowbacteria bacterium]|nr:hypothetical protein [Candidatus Falkowbacteria bacterium]